MKPKLFKITIVYEASEAYLNNPVEVYHDQIEEVLEYQLESALSDQRLLSFSIERQTESVE